MADIVPQAVRSKMMREIRGRDTLPELLVRRGLHRRGLRHRLGGRGLPGRPDLVYPGIGAALFVHGCFWHRHEGCRYATTPVTRAQFWQEKFEANVERDRRAEAELKALGWRVLVVWECELRREEVRELRLDELASQLKAWRADVPSRGEGSRRGEPEQFNEIS